MADVSQVIKNLSNFKASMVNEIVAGCQAVQQQVINDAKDVVPVVTGNLQGSIQPGDITITDDNVQAVVLANAEYASYVEFGTSRMSAEPYLGPALLQNQQTFVKAIAAAVGRAQAR